MPIIAEMASAAHYDGGRAVSQFASAGDGSWRLTPYMTYGTVRHMARAALAFHDKQTMPDGSVLEMKIWVVPVAVRGSRHHFKYQLFYGRAGERIVGYDNEAGKGDHRHVKGREEPYVFTSVEQLMQDFLADVRRVRGES